MVSFEIEILINSPPEIVDEALWNPENAVYWNKGLERFEVVKGEPRKVGTVGRLHFVQGGKKHIMEDVLEYSDPGRRYRSRVSGPAIEAIVETTLEPVDGKTKVKVVWDGKGKKLLVRLMLRFFINKLIRQSNEEFKTFKRLVETYGAEFEKDKKKQEREP
jgi:hypothetical protein